MFYDRQTILVPGFTRMAETPDVAKLAQAVEAQDPSVVATLSALPDRCLVDSRNRTLFDVAILANNTDAIALLATDSDALEFAAPIDTQIKDPIRQSAAMHDIERPISKLEAVLRKSFGEDIAYGRTPLHTASRAGNYEAIEKLLASGAKTNGKDAIGLTAPELAFYAHGDVGLRGLVGACDGSNVSALPVGKRLLRETFAYPETLEKLLGVAKLDAHAKRLLFSYRCAWLDIDAVKGMLADGHDPNKGVTADINPLWAACTSAPLWDESIPGGFEMAYHFTKHWGHPNANSVSFDSALLNEDGSNLGQLMAEAKRKQKEQVAVVEQLTIDPDTEREVIARRVAMLDVLLEAGADKALARKKVGLGSFA
ncbi:MAG: ankyrin repeat domain-containing protein, partial [Pseudomonadota bacterium]